MVLWNKLYLARCAFTVMVDLIDRAEPWAFKIAFLMLSCCRITTQTCMGRCARVRLSHCILKILNTSPCLFLARFFT